MSARDVSAKAVADDLNERAERAIEEADRLDVIAQQHHDDATELREAATLMAALADRVAHLDTPAGGAS